MKTLKFKCTLLSDVILNVKSATEGSNKTLDFIPGSNFLGMVAARLYCNVSQQEALDLFHNGAVRYGDAHLAIDCKRSLKVPAAMYHPKLKKESEELYIYYEYDREKDPQKQQLKQCRDGFYAFDGEHGVTAVMKKSFAIKSAYDRSKRKSKDEQMFGYESLCAGLEFFFSVETDNNNYEKEITEALVGKRHLGRSRNAQYGLVEISQCDFQEVVSHFNTGNITTVYADSRLIFLDKYGEPTFQPTAKDLGFEGGKIIWEKSQIRTFQYAPWNSKRQAYDTDRCGIEKGSVFVVEGGNVSNREGKSLGYYVNEGFGKVIYSPSFLAVQEGTNGRARCILRKKEHEQGHNNEGIETDLTRFLAKREKEESQRNDIYKLVNDFVEANEARFKEGSFASQWGTIRSIATSKSTTDEIRMELFDKQKKNSKGKLEKFAYLTHGVAEEKWEKNKRLEHFKEFFDNISSRYDDALVREALINLASQMAKLYRKEENNG